MRNWKRILAVFSFFGAVFAGAGEKKYGLDAVAAVTSSGVDIRGARLSSRPKWILIYVLPGCRPCDNLLAYLGKNPSPERAKGVVVLVGPKGKEAPEEKLSFESPFPVFWDKDGGAAEALGLNGAPAVAGISEGNVEWAVNGVIDDPASLQTLADSWLEPAP